MFLNFFDAVFVVEITLNFNTHEGKKLWRNQRVGYRSMVAQMAEGATQDPKVLGSIPAWIQ